MSSTLKALAVNSRKIAHDYVDKMESELRDLNGSKEKAEEYMQLAKHHYSEAKKQDDEAGELS